MCRAFALWSVVWVAGGQALVDGESVISNCAPPWPRQPTGDTCSLVRSGVEQLAGVEKSQVEALVKEGGRFCGCDLPLASAEAEVIKVEEFHEANPDHSLLAECLGADYMHAMHSPKESHADDEKVAAVAARWAAVCPE
jgi:hypothetical protein